MRLTVFVLCASFLGAAAPPITIPLSFEPNVGQTDAKVKYLAHGQGGILWLTERGPVLGLAQKRGVANLKMRFGGANPTPRIEAEGRRTGASNYLIGRDATKWRTGVPQFERVRYRSLYPGIDVVFYGNPETLEYDFVLAPGADPTKIQLAFEGVDRMTINAAGDLILKLGEIEVRNRKPIVYQGNTFIEGHYVARGKRKAGFIIDGYDATQPLVIDPVLSYATYLGGTGGDQATGTAVDLQGNIYVTGQTDSVNFPTKMALYATKSETQGYGVPTTNVFLTKINPASSGGPSVVYSTFFGGDNFTFSGGMAVDRGGNAYITGTTASDDLPLKNAFQTTLLGGATCDSSLGNGSTICNDAFVAKFSASGDALLYSSYLGGSNFEGGNGIAVDLAGNAYVVGFTRSIDFPVRGAPYQTSLRGSQDGFLSQISAIGSLVYSTYFGGEADEGLQSVAVDSAGILYVAGSTTSTQIPTTQEAIQSHILGSVSGFAAKFNTSLGGNAALLYCTYLGGAGGSTAPAAVAFDPSGNIYIAGATTSPSFPVTPSAAKGIYSDSLNFLGASAGDGFVAKLNPFLSGNAQLVYSTFVGGSFDDAATGMAVDSAGRITVTGFTDSFDFPVTPDAFQCCFDGIVQPGFITQYGFLARLDPSKSGSGSLLYSTLVGGTLNTSLTALAMDVTGNTVVVAGTVQSPDTPVTSSAFQLHYAGQLTSSSNFGNFGFGDAYIARFDFTNSGALVSQIENAAGLAAINQTTLSPGLIFAIKGNGLGPTTAAGAQIDPDTGRVSNDVAGVQVLVDGTAVPLTYISATQINAIAPYELATKVGQVVRVQVVYNGVGGNLMPAVVAATAPAIFSFDDGSGPGAILNQDLTLNGPANPAARGSIISFYATGEGQTNPPGVDGRIATDSLANLPRPTAAVSLSIGGVAATNIVYAGTVPTGVAGFFQVNVTVPQNVAPGPAVPIILTVGGASSPKTLTMAVQ